MNTLAPDSAEVFPAIYDFSILPIGLGSILGWNIKQSIRTIEAGKKSMDVYVMADHQCLSNFFQGYLNEKSFQVHLWEVIWAFYTNPMMRNFYVYHDRAEFDRVLQKIAVGGKTGERLVSEYEKAKGLNTCRKNADQLLIEYCEGYKSIFKFYEEKGFIPNLIEPRGCDLHASAFRERIGKDKFVVTTNFRMGSLAVLRAEDADAATASTFSVWYDFFKLVERKFPDVLFLVLGKLPEIPTMCFDLKNVVSPRHCGLNLGHELSLIKKCDLFLGAASGFASMAWFNDCPFIITGLNNEGYSWVGYEFGIERYNFSNQNQRLVFETESIPMLLKHFGKHYQQWKKKQASPAPVGESKTLGRTSFLYNRDEELKTELRAYIFEKISETGNFKNSENASTLLGSLDSLGDRYSEFLNSLMIYHSARALALFQLKRYEEAWQAIYQAEKLEPDNPSLADIRKMIERKLQKDHGSLSFQ